jgi:hypothetical protein
MLLLFLLLLLLLLRVLTLTPSTRRNTTQHKTKQNRCAFWSTPPAWCSPCSARPWLRDSSLLRARTRSRPASPHRRVTINCGATTSPTHQANDRRTNCVARLSVCVCLSACLPACLRCLPACLCVCLDICLSAGRSVGLSGWLAVGLSVCRCVCLSVWLSGCPPVSLSHSLQLSPPPPLYLCLYLSLSLSLSLALSLSRPLPLPLSLPLSPSSSLSIFLSPPMLPLLLQAAVLRFVRRPPGTRPALGVDSDGQGDHNDDDGDDLGMDGLEDEAASPEGGGRGEASERDTSAATAARRLRRLQVSGGQGANVGEW